MKILRMLILVLMVALISGCIEDDQTVCYEVPAEDSWLCSAADKSGVSLESVSLGISLVSSVATSTGKYSRQDALAVITAIEVALGKSVTYTDFKESIIKETALYPDMIRIGYILRSVLNIPEIIKPVDLKILKNWLNFRKKQLS